MSWKIETFGSLLKESRIACDVPDIERRIRVKLNVQGVEKRPVGAEKEGATKQFIRKSGQFIYGKQNFHKGAFGIIPEELDGYETSADIPSFDVREDCLPEWIFYYFKSGNRYLELIAFARGVGSQRIHPNQLTDYEIPLPPIDEQRKIIEELKILESNQIAHELTHQLDLVKQLRQAFLREAMQGKLTAAWRAENPTTEPASQLLARIKAEKEKVVKEAKLKKQKPLPPIKADEIPFEIPEGWVWCRLGEIAYITSGSTPSQSAFVESGIPYLKMYNLKNQKIDFFFKPQYIKEEVHNGQLKRCRAYSGDIIMNIVGPPLGKIAIIPENLPECNFNQAAVLIRPFKKEMNFYIFWYLNELSEIKAIETKGVAGQDNISVTQAHNMRMPLPPFVEQLRVVQKLDELMHLCDQLEASIKTSQQQNELLLQQVLREALASEG